MRESFLKDGENNIFRKSNCKKFTNDNFQRRVFGSGQTETPGPSPTGMRGSPTMLTMRLKPFLSSVDAV